MVDEYDDSSSDENIRNSRENVGEGRGEDSSAKWHRLVRGQSALTTMLRDDPELEVLHLEEGAARVTWSTVSAIDDSPVGGIDNSKNRAHQYYQKHNHKKHSNSSRSALSTKPHHHISQTGWDSKFHSAQPHKRHHNDERPPSPSIYHKLVTLFYDSTRRKHGKVI